MRAKIHIMGLSGHRFFPIPTMMVLTMLLLLAMHLKAQDFKPIIISGSIEPFHMDTIQLSNINGFSAKTPGLSKEEPIKFLEISLEQGLPTREIWSIAQDKDGFIWLGTRRSGLLRYDGQWVYQVSTLNGLPSNSVRKVLPLPSGEIWLGTDAGIAVLKGDQLVTLRSGDPSLQRIMTLLQDDNGKIWAASNAILKWEHPKWFIIHKGEDTIFFKSN